jgi:hypothetical protein
MAIKRPYELDFMEETKFGHYTFEPQGDVFTAVYYPYRPTPEEVRDEYRSQVYIDRLGFNDKAIFFGQLNEVLEEYKEPDGRLTLERGCAVIAGRFP